MSSSWDAVLADVKRQAAQPNWNRSDTENAWFDLAEDSSTSSSDRQTSPRWHQHDWAAAFDVLFFQAPPPQLPSEDQDDLLFFVYLDAYQVDEPYTVRRRGKTLPADLCSSGRLRQQIDWKRTVLLNLVTQTAYSMTVSACPRQHLHLVGRTPSPLDGVIKVTKAVYASTTKSQLNLNNRKAEQSAPTLTYPDMSFAVDNFDEAFESLLLTQQEHCYLVLLTATGGMTFREASPALPSRLSPTAAEPAQASGSSQESAATESMMQHLGSPQHPLSPTVDQAAALQATAQEAAQEQKAGSQSSKGAELTIFSGFVSYEQLEQKLLGPRKGPWWLQKPVEGPHPVRMRGPGGVGCADVAVTCLAKPLHNSPASTDISDTQSQPAVSPPLTWEELRGNAASPESKTHKLRHGLLGSAIGAAANVVKFVANTSPEKQARAGQQGHDMRCALMNLTLPVDALAHQLLQ